MTKSKKIAGAAISTVLLVGGFGATSASAASNMGGAKPSAVTSAKKGTNVGTKAGTKAGSEEGSGKESCCEEVNVPWGRRLRTSR